MRFIRFSRSSVTGLAVAAVCSWSLMDASAAAAKGSARSGQKANDDPFFASREVLRIEIEVTEAALKTLRQYEWQFGPATERESVSVTVREGQNTYTNVALHLKGAAG